MPRQLRCLCIALSWLTVTKSKLSGVDLSDQLTFSDTTDSLQESSKTGNGAIRRAHPVPAQPRTVTVDPKGRVKSTSDTGYGFATLRKTESPAASASSQASPEGAPIETPRGSMKATLKRLGAQLPDDEDESSLREALVRALQGARMPLLRGVLFERAGSCAGCTERAEYVDAVLSSLASPIRGRHALPLFLFNTPLFPHTHMRLHLFEPRYKLLCRRALKAERLFGIVVGAVGTLARITEWSFTDGDAADGSCHVSVIGLRRFRLGRQWTEPCAGCPQDAPLHVSDVLYFNDTEPSGATLTHAASSIRQAKQLHHAVTSLETQRQLEQQIGQAPTASEGLYALSCWLSAACVAMSDTCRVEAEALLSSTSLAQRMRRVIKAQRALVQGGAARGDAWPPRAAHKKKSRSQPQ